MLALDAEDAGDDWRCELVPVAAAAAAPEAVPAAFDLAADPQARAMLRLEVARQRLWNCAPMILRTLLERGIVQPNADLALLLQEHDAALAAVEAAHAAIPVGELARPLLRGEPTNAQRRAASDEMLRRGRLK
jgi:hypothetical protein